ncbi:MAG: DUF2100 domain-containing protein [Candidatus Jordarchaeum sp.]|uniref:DUF2100 domain-containing protein n=1 Tax=Candidatus Jordarchaeum sp. TaxID=2823881 RepID=UPI00404A1D1F
MNFDYDDVDRINRVVDALISILCEVRFFAPGYNFDSTTEEKIRNLLINVRDFLSVLMEKFGLDQRREMERIKVKTVDLRGILFVVVSSSTRKRLLELGVDPRFVVVTGGPLNAIDVKSLNPSISDEALETVRKKVEGVWRDIEARTPEVERILVLVEEGNKGDLMVSERADEIQRKTGLRTLVKTFSSVQDLSPDFFEGFLGEVNV